MRTTGQTRNASLATEVKVLVDTYEAALQAGMDQREAYDAARRAFEKEGVPPLQAANLVRLIIALVGQRHGERVYSESELAVIVDYASGIRK